MWVFCSWAQRSTWWVDWVDSCPFAPHLGITGTHLQPYHSQSTSTGRLPAWGQAKNPVVVLLLSHRRLPLPHLQRSELLLGSWLTTGSLLLLLSQLVSSTMIATPAAYQRHCTTNVSLSAPLTCILFACCFVLIALPLIRID